MMKKMMLTVCLCVLMAGSTPVAALTPGALIDLDAFNNAGADTDQWTNNGVAGGFYNIAGDGPAPVRTVGLPTYYSTPNGGAWCGKEDRPSLTGLGDGWSAEMWVRLDATRDGEHQLAVLFGDSAEANRPYLCLHAGGDGTTVDMRLIDNGEAYNVMHSNLVALDVGQWTQFVITFDDATDEITAYKNGGFVGTQAATGAEMADVEVGMGTTLFKSRPTESDAVSFNGAISRFRLYDFVLDVDQALDNYNYGNTVPEPMTTGLLALGGLGLLRRRRK